MRARVERWRWLGVYWAFRAVIFLVRRLPTRLCYAVAGALADASLLVFRAERRNLVRNFRRVLGDEAAARQAARASMRHFSKYVVDFCQLPHRGEAEVRRRLIFEERAELDRTLAKGRGTIFVTLHFGQWEMGGAALAAHGYPVNVIAETFPYRPLDDLVQGLRKGLGMKIVPAEKAKLATFRALARNEVAGMMIDVVEPGEGVVVDFFGARAEMSGAPARIALRTGAQVVPGVILRDDDDPTRLRPILRYDLGWQETGDEDRDVANLTRAMAAEFEALLREHPEQWYPFHEMWPARLNPHPLESARRREAWRYWTLLLALKLLGWLPKRPAYALAKLVAAGAYRVRRGMRADVEDNMRHVLGPSASDAEVSGRAKEAVRNVCLYYADLIRLPRTRSETLLRHEIRLHGFDRLTDALAGGRGAVIAAAHTGNPEIAVQIAGLLGLDVLVLSEPLEPPEFSELVHGLRASNPVRYEEVSFSAVRHALRHLRAGNVVGIACDRDIQGTGTPLPFFGEVTKMPLGAVELAVRTGAALVPAHCERRADGYDVYFEEPLPLVRTGDANKHSLVNARRLIERLEQWIANDPGQWMVLERVWRPVGSPGQTRGKPAPGATMASTADT